MEISNKHYMPYIDMLKGIAILLMVMGHSIAWSFEDYSFLTKPMMSLPTQYANAALLWKFIYSFHMPLLFLISGYLFYKKETYNGKIVKTLIKKRVMRILIPYFTTGFLLLFYKGIYGYWFLQVILMLDLVYIAEQYMLSKFFSNPRWTFLSHVVVFLFLWAIGKLSFHHDIYIGKLASAYVYFIVGVTLKQYPRLTNFQKKNKVQPILLSLYLVLFLSLDVFGYELPMSLLFSLLMTLSLCLFLLDYLQSIEYQLYTIKWGGGKLLALIGRNSLEIYILHIYFTMSLLPLGNFFLSCTNWVTCFTSQLVFSILVSFVSIALSLLVSQLLSSMPIVRLLFFGKK